MSPFYQRDDRFSRSTIGCILVGVLVFLFTLGAIGWLEYNQKDETEIDFKLFKWPPYVNVKRQVERELSGLEPEIVPLNNWTDFQTLAQPKYKQDCTEKELLIIVKTAPNRFERREAYRKTLATIHSMKGYEIRFVFVLGADEEDQSSIQMESKLYDDMLIGDFVDNYYNNTYKFMHSLKFANNYCPESSAPFVMLLDDDFLLRLDNTITFIDSHSPDEKLYAGHKSGPYPSRSKNDKYYISVKDYPFNLYPSFLSGGCVIYSPRSIREFYIAAQHLKMFKFDDVYEGIIAYHLDYVVQDVPRISVYRNSPISWNRKIAEHGYSAEEIANGFLLTRFTHRL